MHYADIKYFDIANGPGVRTTLFVSGCTHHCKNCFQPETWNFNFGIPFTKETEEEIIESLKHPNVQGLTLLGGEPLEPQNTAALLPFVKKVKTECPTKDIWCFTGDVLEELLNNPNRCNDDTEKLLSYIDVLVDGPYIEDLHDITLRFRGSSNQRIIDLPQTLKQGHTVLWEDKNIYSSHSL